MIDLDELMRLRAAATPGPWKAEKNHTAYDSWGDSVCYTQQCHNHDNNLAYITAACNAVPELVARIRELEEQRDWMAQAADKDSFIMRRFTEVK